ncbi:MAG: DNA polymerase I [Phycisphaerales bacterium]|nr:DNA polymerase I [Phycisphaerales bacterium]
MKTLYLIDGHAAFFRAYYAIRNRMTSPVTREPTNATYGFVSMLIKLLREQKPDYLAVVIDVGGEQATFRSELYPEYKANRDAPPDDFRPQVERCLEILEAMRIPVLAAPGYEADDVIATLATRLTGDDADPDLHIRIVSKDKDLMQLLGERVDMFDSSSDEVLDEDALREKHGLAPAQVADMLTLAGDTVDNVPGVPGIGVKTAAKLIAEFGSVDALLDNIESLKGKRKENILAAREKLPLSRQLVTLCRDVQIDFDLESASADPAMMPLGNVDLILKQLGFGRHRNDLATLTGQPMQADADARASAAAPPDSLFAGVDCAEAPQPVADDTQRGEYACITTTTQLNSLVRELKKAEWIAVDTETDSLSPRRANLCGISVSVKPMTGAYIPIRSPDPALHLDAETVLAALRPILEDPDKPKVGHNLKFDLLILRNAGVSMRGALFDTMVASYLVDASRSSHKLDYLALGLLNHHCIPITDLIGTKGRGKTQKTFDQVPLDVAATYAAEDADIALRLKEHFQPQLRAMGIEKLFRDTEMPLVAVLAELEWNGIRVDPDELDRQADLLRERISGLKGDIQNAAPRPFNPDSPKQLSNILFSPTDAADPGLGLRPIKKTKTGYSTDVEVLEKLAADPDVTSPIPTLIVEYRTLTKLVNTYLTALAAAINPDTGRVHASFNQTVAATGRLSSSKPNLQNIPIRTEIGREIRKAFKAEPGNTLVSADYSQIELRILAHLSGDSALIDAFQRDVDIHTVVAAEVFDTPVDDVTREQRSGAKMVNFGIVYGITPFGLARRLGAHPDGSPWTVEEAARIIDDYKKRFPRIDEFLGRCIDHAQRLGYVETMLGRRRAIPQIASNNPQQRALGARMAINSVVQGSAADLIKLAMIDLHRSLPEVSRDAKMLLQIHDELVFECPECDTQRVMQHVAERMEQVMALQVPLKVDAAAAATWFEGK